MGKANGRGTFSKCVAELNYHLIIGPYFENAPHLYSKHKMISFEEAVLKREITPNNEARIVT